MTTEQTALLCCDIVSCIVFMLVKKVGKKTLLSQETLEEEEDAVSSQWRAFIIRIGIADSTVVPATVHQCLTVLLNCG